MRPVSRLTRTAVAVAASVFVAACHHAAPAVTASPPRSDNTSDDAARRARARADSIARADAARRDSLARVAARADSARRAADALRTAEDAARAALVAPVHFDFDLSEIRPDDRAILDRKAAILVANPTIRMRIDGNADDRGSDEYNLALGMRRASEVHRYLTQRGVDSTRITVSSNGEERPLCREPEESCWRQNRRDEFAIVGGGTRITSAR